MASAGKTLTAFGTGIALQNGKLKLTDTSSKYLGKGWSNLSADQEAKITVWHHLTMTTGLDDAVTDPDCTDKSCLVYKADPGSRWAYHNAPYTLMDKIILGATGQNINNYINSTIKPTTGFTGLYVPLGYNNVYFSTARSFARFGLLMQAKGTWSGTPVLSDTGYFNKMTNSSQSINLSYGYLTWLNGKSSFHIPGLQLEFPGSLMPSAPNDMYAALGKNGQYINVVPSKGLVMIRMGNAPPQGGGLVPTVFNDNLWKYLNKVMCNNSGLEKTNETIFNMYPNPAINKVFFHSNVILSKIELYSMDGRVICEQDGKNFLDLMGVEPGIYMVHAISGKKIIRKVLSVI